MHNCRPEAPTSLTPLGEKLSEFFNSLGVDIDVCDPDWLADQTLQFLCEEYDKEVVEALK